jgi:hypothetical protein
VEVKNKDQSSKIELGMKVETSYQVVSPSREFLHINLTITPKVQGMLML